MAQVAVITGASSGIGLEAAKALARQGWRVIAQGRDAGRSAAAEAEIRAAAPDAQVDFLRADLSSMAETARLADQIAALTPTVDVLINNAGCVGKEAIVTDEGNEALFAGNHLGHFLLTGRLMPLLRAAAKGKPAGTVRILSTSSDAHGMGPGFDWSDLQLLEKYNPGWAYCNAKLANILFTRALAARLADEGIVANAVHPGLVHSNFQSHAEAGMRDRMMAMKGFTPEQGADTLVWLATDPEGGRVTGDLFHQRKPFPIHEQGMDEESLERLWTESEKLIARAGVAA